jgi:rfaE bifunctional protein kinase chain/domain
MSNSNSNKNPVLEIDSKIDSKLREKLVGFVSQLSGKKILIVGDLGLDEYILGEVRRISPEAPVPVLDVESEDLRLGLSGNVAQNVSSLGGTPVLVSVVGRDTGADLLSQLLAKTGVSAEHLVVDPKRPTTRKVRIMAKHHHLVRVDYELRRYLSPETEKIVLQKVAETIADVDAVIVEDYAKGVISNTLLQEISKLAKKHGKKVLVDPHKTNRGEFYNGIDLLKPNFDEAVALSGINYEDLKDHPDQVFEVAQALQKLTGAKELVITRGKDGMILFSENRVVQVPTYARQVFDVTGAGDTVIATLALGLSAGLNLTEACMLANFAAGVVVGHIGCVPCTVQELKNYIQSFA